MNWVDVFRELYIGSSGFVIGIFIIIIHERIRQPDRWARGLAFVAASLIGFILLSMLGFAAHLGEGVTTSRIFFYPIPLILLAIGTYLISTSDIGVSHFHENGKEDQAPNVSNH